jgi:hypothetical protein
MLKVESVLRFDRVASIGALLRPALVSRTVGVSSFAGQRGIGVKGRFPDA